MRFLFLPGFLLIAFSLFSERVVAAPFSFSSDPQRDDYFQEEVYENNLNQLSVMGDASEQAFQVTVADYVLFLNAVAASDPHALYNDSLSASIVRLGLPGAYRYRALLGKEKNPITCIRWWDAARFCNWKEHGSPARELVLPTTTEEGSYTLQEGEDSITPQVIPLNEGAHYGLPQSEEDLPSACQTSRNPLSYWGSSSHAAQEAPLIQGGLQEQGTEVRNPDLGDVHIGFCVTPCNQDLLDIAGLRAVAYPSKATVEKVGIGAGIAMAIAALGSAAYYRYAHRDVEMLEAEGSMEERSSEDSSERRSEERAEVPIGEISISERSDVVSGRVVNVTEFISDKRSFFKKWADALRERGHQDSIYEGVDDIDFIEGLDLLPRKEHSFSKKAIYWMTQSFYPYKDVGDFLAKNATHQRQLMEEYKRYQEEQKREKEELQERIQRNETARQQAQENKDQTRIVRLNRAKKERPELNTVEGYLSQAAMLQKSWLTTRRTSFEYLQSIVNQLTIKRFQPKETTASKSKSVSKESSVIRAIQEQHENAWRAYTGLMEEFNNVTHKKELLWHYRACMKNDFTQSEDIKSHITSIRGKFSEINMRYQKYCAIIKNCFDQSNAYFRTDSNSASQTLKNVTPSINNIEKFFNESYELLYLAEANAVEGEHVMLLYEDDQNKQLWKNLSLRLCLKKALSAAQKRAELATNLLYQEQVLLGGEWEKMKPQEIVQRSKTEPFSYSYSKGGWQQYTSEADIVKEIQNLKSREDAFNHGGYWALLESEKEQALKFRPLLQDAAQKGVNFLNQLNTVPGEAFAAARAAFLEAVKAILENPILQEEHGS